MLFAQQANISTFLPSAVASRWTRAYNDVLQEGSHPGTPNKVHEFKIQSWPTLKKSSIRYGPDGYGWVRESFYLAQQFTENIIENKIHIPCCWGAIQDIPSEDDPVEDAQSQDVTVNDVPSQDVPSEYDPMQDVPSPDVISEDDPTEDT